MYHKLRYCNLLNVTGNIPKKIALYVTNFQGIFFLGEDTDLLQWAFKVNYILTQYGQTKIP